MKILETDKYYCGYCEREIPLVASLKKKLAIAEDALDLISIGGYPNGINATLSERHIRQGTLAIKALAAIREGK